LTAHDPSFANDLKLRLGAVTVEDWYNGKNQLWELEEREVYIPEEKAELSSGGSSSVNKTATTGNCPMSSIVYGCRLAFTQLIQEKERRNKRSPFRLLKIKMESLFLVLVLCLI